ncbi:MAG TPA: DUF3089 domain-containing protein [Kofleriaceae bacterium]|nr:DUF3089 domain-containing protein [Kofleriaceae bacterium]
MRLALAALLVACSAPSRSEQPRTSSAAYRDPAMWLCRPDLPGDACRGDLATTELLPDGGKLVRAHAPATDAPVDCFYIYPTIDLNLIPGNHVDFSNLASFRKTAGAQIARLSEVCNIYAPLYRQATIATYVSSRGDQQHFFDVAYSDVAAAFHAYLLHFDRGKPIVIVGHSQGAQHAAHLLRDTFDQSDALRPRLLVALPIGFTVDLPDGATTGGTFEHLAPCTRPDETACFVAYMSLRAGDPPSVFAAKLPPGHHAACVDPATGPTLRESVFPTGDRAGKLGVTTPYVSVSGFYRAACETFRDGRAFLAIAEAREPGDRRPSLIDLGNPIGGLHIYDMQLAQGDLIELVRVKTAAYLAAHRRSM